MKKGATIPSYPEQTVRLLLFRCLLAGGDGSLESGAGLELFNLRGGDLRLFTCLRIEARPPHVTDSVGPCSYSNPRNWLVRVLFPKSSSRLIEDVFVLYQYEI